MTLAAATEAAKRGDWASALVAALAVWREVPHGRLAGAIEELGRRAAAAREPLGGDRWAERNRLWFAAARRRDPVERTQLLATAGDCRGAAELIARLDKLAGIDDPRIDTALRELAAAKRSWYAAVRYIEDRLAARAAPDRAWPAELDAEVAALVDACTAVPGDDAAHEAALLAAIYAAPSDDGPRLVYADWLQAKGDPRGEFIALQILARGSERARGLEAIYGERWKGPLAPHIEPWGYGFARGFLAWVRIEPGRAPPPDPAWAVVAQTTGGLPPLASARGLTHAGELHHADVMALARCAAPPPLVRLELAEWPRDYDARAGTWDAASREASAALARATIPTLRALHLAGSPSWVDDDGMSPARLIWPWRELGVEELALRTAMPQLAAWIAAANAAHAGFARLTLRTSRGWRYLVGDWRATVTRGADGTMSALHVTCGTTISMPAARSETALFATALAEVPADALTELAVTLPKLGLLEGSGELRACLAAIDRQRRLVKRAIDHRGKR